jgi:galactokinase
MHQVLYPMSEVSVSAPGRVELLGNHTDYNQGLVLGVAINRTLTMRGQRRDDGIISLVSRAFPEPVEAQVGHFEARRSNSWANYPLGVVREFLRAGYAVNGFHAEVSGDLPIGMGLASSAALAVATAGLVTRLFDLEIAPLALAKICQRAENDFVGVRSGLLDQVTCLSSRANHAVYLDCRSEEIRLIPFPGDLTMVIADSGAKRRLVASEYNVRREECAEAARSLGITSLREISLARLGESNPALSPLLRRRTQHVVEENDRVTRAVEAMSREDAAFLGRLLNESHESSRFNFENSTPELDRLVSVARSLPGVLGARLTGGGFGGAALALAETAQADAVAEQLACQAPKGGAVFICRTADGAGGDR